VEDWNRAWKQLESACATGERARRQPAGRMQRAGQASHGRTGAGQRQVSDGSATAAAENTSSETTAPWTGDVGLMEERWRRQAAQLMPTVEPSCKEARDLVR
jgi:hypothetical protein